MSHQTKEELFDRELRALGYAATFLNRYNDGEECGGVVITGMSIRLDADEGTSTLAVLRGFNSEGRFVAFVGASSFSDCLLAVGKRCKAEALRWRPDQYARE